MKKLIPLFYFIVFAHFAFAGKQSSLDHHAPILKAMLRKLHVNPIPEDDKFYSALFNDFIKDCDPGRIYFLQSDIDLFRQKQSLLADEINGKNHAFLQLFVPIYRQRIAQCDSFIKSMRSVPFNFTIKESYSSSDTTYCKDQEALQNKCRQYLKAQCLHKLIAPLEYDSTLSSASLLKKEPLLREKTILALTMDFDWLLRHPNTMDTVCGYMLCETLASQFDPHTNYFTEEQNNSFKEQVSGEEKLFGFNISENENGLITLTDLIPGSPAWRSGEINNDDVLLAARKENGEWVSFEGEDKHSANALFENIVADRIELLLAKADGSKKNVLLQREKIKPDDNFVRSWIINGASKIGYILLPGFYTETDNAKGAHCADDVAKELVKLKAENIEGLIIDIRNNGGGSMDEAERLAGIFINEGVLNFVRLQEGKPTSMKDPNRGTLFDQPMVVLINGTSASASEMLAGTLQDYNRAVIVGSPSYGKASIQVVFPLDSSLTLQSDFKTVQHTADYTKLTIGKLYRPTGKSCQQQGVLPDIELPDVIKVMGIAESAEKNCLAPDTVKRAVYFDPLPALPIATLKASSNKRLSASVAFQQIEKLKTRLQVWKSEEHKPYSLVWEDFLAQWKTNKNKYVIAAKQTENPEKLEVTNHRFDLEQMVVDRSRKEINNKAIKKIAKDPYIEEGVLVLTELIQLQKK